jgi:hypothetical protein
MAAKVPAWMTDPPRGSSKGHHRQPIGDLLRGELLELVKRDRSAHKVARSPTEPEVGSEETWLARTRLLGMLTWSLLGPRRMSTPSKRRGAAQVVDPPGNGQKLGDLMAAAGDLCWPSAGKFASAYGADLMGRRHTAHPVTCYEPLARWAS